MTIAGTLVDDTLIEPLADGLASVSRDGFMIIDLSPLCFTRRHLVPLTLMSLADSVRAGAFSVVMSRKSDRQLLRSAMTPIPVYAHLVDAFAGHSFQHVV